MPTPRRPGPRRFALTGTPGTGKSTVARRLAAVAPYVEVGTLGRRLGAAQGRERAVVVDLERLRGAMRRRAAASRSELVVGHLAHLLPVDAAVVLRCHPEELLRRLRAARRGTAREREANYVCEATDLVLVEAIDARLPVFEVDTTGRSVAAVAREVRAILSGRRRPRHGKVDWLSDRRVTDHLLRGRP